MRRSTVADFWRKEGIAVKLSDEEEKLIAAYEKREAELGPFTFPADVMKALGVKRMPTLRESFEEANTLYAAGVCNPIKHPGATMRCSECGKALGMCDCATTVLRCFTCERCGFRVMTGGRSLGELLSTDEMIQ